MADKCFAKSLGVTRVYLNGRELDDSEYTLLGRRTILLHKDRPKDKIIRPPWWMFWKPATVVRAKEDIVRYESRTYSVGVRVWNVFYNGEKTL